MNQFKAVIFDMDGVVVDTAIFHFEAWKRLTSTFGFELPDSVNNQLKGVSRIDALKIILEFGNLSVSTTELERLANLKNEWYLEFASGLTDKDILPGIRAFMEELKANNIPIGLASASKNAKPILEKIGLIDVFNSIVDGLDTARAKPDPEVFLKCAKNLQIDPSNCLVIEDAKAGVEAAINAGMKVIGIGTEQELGEANKVISSTSFLNMEFITEI